MHIISLAALTILDAGPIGQVYAAHEAGFSSVGLRLQPLLPSDQAIVGDPEKEEALVAALQETGVRVLELGVFPIRPQVDLDQWARVFAFGAGLGARHVVCPVEDHDEARRIDTLRKVCDAAARHALDVLIEFNPYSACRTLAEAARLARESGRPNARLLVDALHLSRSGGSPDDVRALEPGLKPPLVHFCDAPPPPDASRSEEELRAESRTARLPPGEGALWLDDLLDALGPDVAISVEAPCARDRDLPAAERARRALAATKAVLARRG